MGPLRPDQRAQSSPPTVTVTVRGDSGTLRALGAGDIEASVDVTGLGAGRYTLPVRVAPSSLVGVVRVDPPQVQITNR
jgi:YbbR domain-containing protein